MSAYYNEFDPRPCVVCRKLYSPTAGHQKVCSRDGECFKKYDRDYRRNSAKRKAWDRERERKRRQDPKVKAYRKAWYEKQKVTPQWRTKQAAKQREYLSRPEVKARMKKQRDERRANDPGFARRAAEASRKCSAKVRSDPTRLEAHQAKARENYRKRRERQAQLELAKAAAGLEAKL